MDSYERKQKSSKQKSSHHKSKPHAVQNRKLPAVVPSPCFGCFSDLLGLWEQQEVDASVILPFCGLTVHQVP